MYDKSSLYKSRLRQSSLLFDQPPYDESQPQHESPTYDPWIFKNIESAYQRQPEAYQRQPDAYQRQPDAYQRQKQPTTYIISDADEEIHHYKYEKQIITTLIKLLLHITLISIFETLFYFLYVSSLENNGIENAINTFINGAITDCYNMTVEQIEVIDNVLESYINASEVIQKGNTEELVRYKYNNHISNIAWGYVSGVSGLFIILSVYTRVRKIKINWKNVVLENFAMVILLGLYELLFFNTIVHKYLPISTEELSRDAVKKLQNTCTILT